MKDLYHAVQDTKAQENLPEEAVDQLNDDIDPGKENINLCSKPDSLIFVFR